MDNLEEILSSLPKNKIAWLADKKIKLSLYKLIIKKKMGRLFISKENVSRLSWRYKLVSLSLGIIILFSFTSIYAYANSDIIPGNQLYPLKKAVEKIEEKIAITPSAKIAAYEKFSNRRLQEAVNLSERKTKATESIKKNIEEEVKNNEVVTSSVYKLDEAKAEKAVSKIKKQDEVKLQSLEKIEVQASAKNDREVLEKVKEAKEKIKKREYKKNKKEDIEIYEDKNADSSQVIEKNSTDEQGEDSRPQKGNKKDNKGRD